MQLTWVTIPALAVTAISVVGVLVVSGSLSAALAQMLVLLFPLAVIFWPEQMDGSYRRSWEGFSHYGSSPTPGIMLQIVGWILLMVLAGRPLAMLWMMEA